MGCLPEYGANLICVTVGVFVAAIVLLIPGLDRNILNYQSIFQCFKDSNSAKDGWDCLVKPLSGDNASGWFAVWTIMFAVVTVWFLVWLFISIFASMCCNCAFDEYMCLLGVGLFTTFCGDYLMTLIFANGIEISDGINVSGTIIISAVFNNFTLIIVHFVFLIVAFCVKNWTGCKKVGTIIGGVILSFVIGIIWILSGAPKSCRFDGKNICELWTCVIGGIIGAACFFLNILFAVILDCSCCRCCGCRACENKRR